jgi:hypothetical protein
MAYKFFSGPKNLFYTGLIALTCLIVSDNALFLIEKTRF